MSNLAQTVLTRRRVLTGTAGIALLLAGCTTGAPHKPDPTPRDPLADLMDEHVALRSTYSAAIATAPDDPRLPPLADHVAQHITALAGTLAVPPPSAADPSAADPSAADRSTTDPGSGTAAPSGSAADPAALIAALRDAENAVATHSRALALTQKPQRAPLLASIATAHQCAAEVLG